MIFANSEVMSVISSTINWSIFVNIVVSITIDGHNDLVCLKKLYDALDELEELNKTLKEVGEDLDEIQN